jgi:CBS domain-containing protein
MSTTSTPPIQGSFLLPTLEHATVADAMHPGILTCRAEPTLTEVARLMSTYHVHCVAVSGVSDEGSGETLAWGTISDLELLAAGMAGGGRAIRGRTGTRAGDRRGADDASTRCRGR